MFLALRILPPRRASPCTDVCSVSSSPHVALNHESIPVALHMPSGITSDKKGSFTLFTNRPCRPHCPRTKFRQCFSLFSFESEQTPHGLRLPTFETVSLYSRTSSRSRNRIHCRLGPPFFCISLFMVRLCFHEFSRLSTTPCSHSASFPPSCPAWLKVYPRILNFFSLP